MLLFIAVYKHHSPKKKGKGVIRDNFFFLLRPYNITNILTK